MQKKWIQLSLVLFTAAAYCNPTGGDVQSGSVSMQSSDNLLEIQAGDKSIIHWKDFSIDPGEITRFIQPDRSSVVLNKVIGLTPSMINGVLEANGRVVLVNPSGVVIGKEGVIHAAEFIASTADLLDLSDGTIRRDAETLQTLETGGALINHEGYIQANCIERSGGRVLLLAPEVKISGTIAAETGTVEILGHHIKQSGTINVSGPYGAGTVLIGGDFQGNNSAIINSQSVTMPAGSNIYADALISGNGGRVILWSDQNTFFEGSIQAKGGVGGGNGGFVEISSPNRLRFHGLVNTSAPSGKTGTLLLDPCDIVIDHVLTPSNPVLAASPYDPLINATVATDDIVTVLGVSNLVMSTSLGGGGTGNISLLAGLPISWATANSLTLNAERNITIASDITCTGGGSINLTTLGGTISVSSGGTTTSNITTTGAGTISLTAPFDIFVAASTAVGGTSILQTDSGNIDIASQFGSVYIGDGLAADLTSITSSTGTINITANTGIDVVAGVNATSITEVVTGALNANINASVTGIGDLNVNATTGVLGTVARLGDDAGLCGEVHINVAQGDVNMNCGGMQTIAKIGSQSLIAIQARNMNIDANGFGNAGCLVSVNNPGPVTVSTINLSNDFFARATSGFPAIFPRFNLSFVNTTLNLNCTGNFTLRNTAHWQSGFFPITGGAAITFNIGGNASISSSSSIIPVCSTLITSSIPMVMNVGGNLSITSGNNGQSGIFNAANFDLNVGGDVLVQSSNPPFSITTLGINSAGSEYFHATVGGNMNLGLKANVVLADDGEGLFIVGKNLTMASNAFISSINPPGPNAKLTIVVDNQAPTSPLIGSGSFIMDPNAFIYITGAPGFPPVQIFTARRSQNSVLGSINTVSFVPGPFGVDTSQERWGVYYPQTFVGSPFTIFYKEVAPVLPPSLNGALARLPVVLGNMFDVLEEFKYEVPAYEDFFFVKYNLENAKQYWTRMRARRANAFSNQDFYWVEVDNYRKYYPYRSNTKPYK